MPQEKALNNDSLHELLEALAAGQRIRAAADPGPAGPHRNGRAGLERSGRGC